MERSSRPYLSFCYQSLDSTSEQLKRLTQKGFELPLLVQAHEQTQGKGQKGRFWHSPAGQIYVSLGLYPNQDLALQHYPLCVGILVARFIQRHLHRRLTLKWPNDLLFCGQKVGGILCESYQDAQNRTVIIIGLGLNTHAGSQLPQPHSYGLQQVFPWQTKLREPKLRQEFCHQLCQAIYQGLQKPLAWEAGFSDFAPENGQPWQSPQGQWLYSQGLSSQGALKLRSQTSWNQKPQHIELTSASEKHSWAYLSSTPTTPLMIAELGNSALKVAVFQNAHDVHSGQIQAVPWDGDWRAVFKTMQNQGGSSSVPLFFGSVSPQHEIAFSQEARLYGWQTLKIAKRPLRTWGSYHLSELGMDRLAYLEAIAACFDHSTDGKDPQDHALLISLGTATTIDVMTVSGEHKGGFILAGLQGQLDSLAHSGALLPQLQLMETEAYDSQVLGTSTRTAMLQGVLFNLQAHIEALKTRFHIPETRVFYSGGYTRLVRKAVKAQWIEHAPIYGLREMALGGCEDLTPHLWQAHSARQSQHSHGSQAGAQDA